MMFGLSLKAGANNTNKRFGKFFLCFFSFSTIVIS